MCRCCMMDFISDVRRASEQLNQIRAGTGSRAEPEVGLSTVTEGGSSDSTCHKPFKMTRHTPSTSSSHHPLIPAPHQKSSVRHSASSLSLTGAPSRVRSRLFVAATSSSKEAGSDTGEMALRPDSLTEAREE